MDPIEKLPMLQPAARKAMTVFDEFKNFAFKGRVIDLAVGVVIGAAFSKIIDSLVKNIIMPTLGLVLPGQEGYLGWKWVIRGSEIPYGLFLGDIVNFLIIALALYLFTVKFLGWVLRARKEEAAAPAPPTKDQELLTEIRDLLKSATLTPPTPQTGARQP
jgi:large conductance mechanosensitive channel